MQLVRSEAPPRILHYCLSASSLSFREVYLVSFFPALPRNGHLRVIHLPGPHPYHRPQDTQVTPPTSYILLYSRQPSPAQQEDPEPRTQDPGNFITINKGNPSQPSWMTLEKRVSPAQPVFWKKRNPGPGSFTAQGTPQDPKGPIVYKLSGVHLHSSVYR